MSDAPLIAAEPTITIRLAGSADLAFVRETSLKVHRQATSRNTAWREFEATHGPEVDAWIATGTVLMVDACEGVLLGFAIIINGAVRMLFVKRDFRGNGFGHQLLAAAGLSQPYPAIQPNACWRRWTEAT